MSFGRKFFLTMLLSGASSSFGQSFYPTWDEITPSVVRLPAGERVSALAVHPFDGKRLIVGYSNRNVGGIVASADGGESWNAPIAIHTQLGYVEQLFAHLGRPGTVYLHEAEFGFAGTIMSPPRTVGGRVFASEDFGLSWRQVSDTSGGRGVSTFATDPLRPERLLATRQVPAACCRSGQRAPLDYGIASSIDGGATWVPAAGLPALPGRFAARGPTRSAPTRLFFSSDVAYVSNDSGATWAPFASGWPGRLLSVTPDPSRANVLYAIAEDPAKPRHPSQLIKTDDGGATWRALGISFVRPEEGPPRITVNPSRPNEVWLWYTIDGIYHSADGGEHWALVGSFAGLFGLVPTNSLADDQVEPYAQLVLNPADPGVAYVIWRDRLFRGKRAPFDPIVVEYFYEGDRYWETSLDGEALSQDYRVNPLGILRTGERFGAWRKDDAPAGALGSCRFWSKPESRMRTRVLVLKGFECEAVKADSNWILEGEDEFFAMPPNAQGGCDAGLVPVRRFNNTKRDLNHRFVTLPRLVAEMRSRNWIDEGVRMCARPLRSDE